MSLVFDEHIVVIKLQRGPSTTSILVHGCVSKVPTALAITPI